MQFTLSGEVVMSQMTVKNIGGTLRNEQEQSKFDVCAYTVLEN